VCGWGGRGQCSEVFREPRKVGPVAKDLPQFIGQFAGNIRVYFVRVREKQNLRQHSKNKLFGLYSL
jgi:hypothetical protein